MSGNKKKNGGGGNPLDGTDESNDMHEVLLPKGNNSGDNETHDHNPYWKGDNSFGISIEKLR